MHFPCSAFVNVFRYNIYTQNIRAWQHPARSCDLDDILLEFANKLLNDNIKPDQWSEIDLLSLPKSGDLSLTANYKGISLSSMVSKIVKKMILNRLQPKLDKHLRPIQNGFRPADQQSHTYLHCVD